MKLRLRLVDTEKLNSDTVYLVAALNSNGKTFWQCPTVLEFQDESGVWSPIEVYDELVSLQTEDVRTVRGEVQVPVFGEDTGESGSSGGEGDGKPQTH